MSGDLDPNSSFDSLIIGPGNEMAGTAGRTVAESPGSHYNPLLIYGPVGVGKTHLLMAIGNLAKAIHPNIVVEYITLDDFAESHDAAVAAGEGVAFASRFQEVELMLIDDLQSLTDRTEIANELLNLCTQFEDEGKQLVLVSDEEPEDILRADVRLQRLGAGLTVDVSPPDSGMRLQIVRQRAQTRGVTIPEDVFSFISELEFDNVRKLFAALNRILAFAAEDASELTVSAARNVLEGKPAVSAPVLGIEGNDADEEDEFGNFFSGISDTLNEQVLHWAEDAETKAGAIKPLAGSTSTARVGIAALPGPAARYKFDELIVGSSNEDAIAAASAAASAPGKTHNPLVFVGSAGVGKTQLLNAFGNKLVESGCPIVGCVSAHEFVEDVQEATTTNDNEDWSLRYSGVDALLIDDFHLALRAECADEMFVLLENLVSQGKQVAFASNVDPASASGLERLTVFLSTGRIVRIQVPDRDFREELVRWNLRAERVSGDAELVDYLADRNPDSARVTVSYVQRVVRAAREKEVELTAAFAREILEGSGGETRRRRRSRTSGVIVSPASWIRSQEKVVWQWPDISDQLVEKLR